MPISSSRAFSPPHSTLSSGQGSSSPAQVKKVVIEGRSKHDGASLRMFLKLSVAIDNVLPGASIPLFPEENIRITQSKVHPLDERSVPYHFSSTEQPLLQKTLVALQLGPKSSRQYHTLFPHTSPPLDPSSGSTSRRGRESSTTGSQNTEKYTGYILVSGYNVTLVLPKEFPPKMQLAGPGMESDGEDGYVKDVSSSRSIRGSRRSSNVFHRSYLHMMVGLELFLPYVLTPPKGPFLVSIPVPRCLDNHLKLRISTPPVGSTPTSVPRGSFTSTSSEDDTPGWDFLTDPPVSRKVDKSLHKVPYHQSADDEHSDTPSTHSTPGTELIQGAFQSTDVLHVRWAPPLGRRSGLPKTEDGMRRVAVERTLGKMRCEVLGRERHRLSLGIAYDGVCTGLGHPGVATILGMDIALDVKGRRISWPEDSTPGWAVSGGDAFGGLYSEASPPGSLSRKSSFESTSSSTFLPTLANRPLITPARGSASLLRAPLPNHNTPDYSFENSPNATPPPLAPSSYFPPTAPGSEIRMSRPDVPPGKPVTLKVNLLKLLPPGKNELNFSVRGTIIIDIEEQDFVPLPAFRVLGADRESIDTIVSSQTGDAIIQVGAQLPNTPRRTLRIGDDVHCEEGVGLVLRPWESPTGPTPSPSTSTTPAKQKNTERSQSHMSASHAEATTEDHTATPGLLTQTPDLPCVLTTVTPLLDSSQHTHCVRVNIPMYSFEADTIQFGLALAQPSVTATRTSTAVVDVLYASYAGRQVPVHVVPRSASLPTSPATEVPGESQIIGEMQFLVVVHLEDVEADSGAVEIVYLISEEDSRRAISTKNKGKGREEISVDVLLPCFQLPVARYEVEINCPLSYIAQVRHSTLMNQHITSTSTKVPRLAHFRLPAGFFSTLCLSFVSLSEGATESRQTSRSRRLFSVILNIITHLTLLTILYLLVSMGTEVRQVRDTIYGTARALANGVPYPDIYWNYGAGPLSDQRWTPDRSIPTVSTEGATTTSVTSWEKETIYHPTPTINLADATPVPEKRRPRTVTRGGNARALIPLPAVPFLSLKLPISPETKQKIMKGFMKAWYLIRKAWYFPVDPD